MHTFTISYFLIYILEINLGYTTRINGSSTFSTSLGGIMLEDNRKHDPDNTPIYKVILEPKATDVEMLDLCYETYAPSTTTANPAPALVSTPSAPTGNNVPSGVVAKHQPGREWDSSLFVNLRSIKIVTMYGFLLAVKDFVLAPITPRQAKTEQNVQAPNKENPNPSRKLFLSFLAIQLTQCRNNDSYGYCKSTDINSRFSVF
jgi:hypothetical protein